MTEEKKSSHESPADKSQAKKKPAAAHDHKDAKAAPRAQEPRGEVPAIRPGDEMKVFYRVIEAGKERIQTYEGTVIAIKNAGASKSITVRKNSFGVAVERIFPLNSKLIQKIEIKKHTKVRRAKLFYLRKLKGKASRLKELR
ncbi:MAG: 50S ribosomal protein L19 [Acidobacteriota bacterium]|jgi:large subunit ribosomal protein L19|nr:50S ribosomal protein L19 [Acidobacteriota bacterium]